MSSEVPIKVLIGVKKMIKTIKKWKIDFNGPFALFTIAEEVGIDAPDYPEHVEVEGIPVRFDRVSISAEMDCARYESLNISGSHYFLTIADE